MSMGTALRSSLSVERYAFDPSQKRDDKGRWTATGSGAVASGNDAIAIRRFLEGEPISRLTGNEFAKTAEPLTVRVAAWFQSEHGGKVFHPEIGEVLLNERGVKDSLSHGIGRDKAAAFAAVPDVIANGRIIDRQENWKGRRYDGFTIAAPVRIGDRDFIAAVVVHRDERSTRFYLHEVGLREKLQTEAFKTGADAEKDSGGRPGASAGAIKTVLQKIYAATENSTSPNDRHSDGNVNKYSRLVRSAFQACLVERYGRKNAPGQKSLLTGEKLASEKTQGAFRWITIGGSSGEKGEHEGGTPVKIESSTGQIVGGPQALKDKGIENLKDFGKQSESRERAGSKTNRADTPATAVDAQRQSASPVGADASAARATHQEQGRANQDVTSKSVAPYDQALSEARQHVAAADMSTHAGETHAMNRVVQVAKKHGVSANELWRELTWSSSSRDIEAEVSGEADEHAREMGIPDALRGSNAVLEAREKDKRDAIEKLPKKQKQDVSEGRIKMVQAPKGGATSDVNGKFYKGGHWMPVHGLSAGQPKPDAKSVAEADGTTPTANASGKAPTARQLSPEQVTAEQERQRDQQRWDKLKSGPLSKAGKWLGDSPNSKAITGGGVSLNEWQQWASEVGPDGVKRLIGDLEPQVHAAIDADGAAHRDEWEKTGGRHSAGSRAPQADDDQWQKDQIKRQAEDAIASRPRTNGTHEKEVPGSHYARELVSEMLHRNKSLDGLESLSDAMEKASSGQAGASPKAAPAAPFKPAGVPGAQMGLFGQTNSGQEQLFNVAETDKPQAPREQQEASLTEKIGDALKQQSQANVSLPGQKTFAGATHSDDVSTNTPNVDTSASAREGDQVIKDIAAKVAKKLVEDFGEHIPGSRKELAVGKAPAPKKAKSDDERPAWARRYQVSRIAKSSRKDEEGKWTIGDTRQKDRWTGGAKKATDQLFDSKEEAEAAIPLLEVSRNHRVIQTAKGEPVDPAAYEQWQKDQEAWNAELNSDHSSADHKAIFDRRPQRPPFKNEQWAIARDVSDRKRPIVKGGFSSREEAMKHMASNAPDIIEHKFPSYETYKYLDHVERKGPQHRDGNVKPDDFQQAFGVRGGQFGNWNSGKDGQESLNHAYDSFMDLADVLQIDPKAIALNGDLAMAFGARGTGGKDAALAHYEPDLRVINLTKLKGAGSLAHEWSHALDHMVHRTAGVTEGHGISEPSYKAKTRPELKAAAKELLDTMMGKTETYEVTAAKTANTDEVEALQADMAKRHPNESWESLRNSVRVVSPKTINGHMHNLRAGLHEMANWKKKKLSDSDLKEWDELSQKISNGDYGKPMTVETKGGGQFSLGRSTYENLEKLNQLHAKMVGRGFHTKDEHSPGNKARWAIWAKLEDDKRSQAAAEGATQTRRVHSDFLREARTLDETSAGDYYAQSHEMFARAFESYVDDKLKAANRRSDYLVGKDTTNASRYRALLGASPFPDGEERTRINTAFDKLFDAMRGHELPTAKGTKKSDTYSRARSIGDVVRYAMREAMKDRYAKDANGREHDELGRFVGQGVKHRQFKGDETAHWSHVDTSLPNTRQAAREHGKTLAHYRNADTGDEIHVHRDGIRHSLQRGTKDFRIVNAIPQLIEHAKLFATESPKPGSPKEIREVRHFFAPLMVGVEPHVAHMIVKHFQSDEPAELAELQLHHLGTRKERRFAANQAVGEDGSSLVSRDSKPPAITIDQLITAVKDFRPEHVHPEHREKYSRSVRSLPCRVRDAFQVAKVERYERSSSLRDRIASAASDTDRSPTADQKAAGNYRKGKFWLWGHEVSIENPKGSTRSGVGSDGKPWSVTMAAHYGYIRRTVSKADGDAVDVFIGPHPESEIVFVVNQQKPSGRFDEHKCLLGCRSLAEAKQLYLSCYSAGWQGIQSIVPMTRQHFLKWLERGDTSRAVKANDSIERYSAEWEEKKHPRGQPDNAGQFAKTDGSREEYHSAAIRDSAPSRDKLAIERFWMTRPVLLQGDEIATLQEPFNMPQLRQAARDWSRENLPQVVQNKETGWTLTISRKGFQESLAHGSGPQKIQSLAGIPLLLKQSVLVESLPNRHGKPLIDHTFAAQLNLNGEAFVVSMVVHEDTNGRRFYDHELMEMKNLDQVLSQVGAASPSEVGRPVPGRGSINKIVMDWLRVNPKPVESETKTQNRREHYDRSVESQTANPVTTGMLTAAFQKHLERRAYKERGELLPENLKRSPLPAVPQKHVPEPQVKTTAKIKPVVQQPKRQPGDGTPGWQKVGGSSVFVDRNGKITKGCPGLKGEHVSDLIDESHESRERREVRNDHAVALGKDGKDFTPSQLKRFETKKAREQHAAAKDAAKAMGVATHHVLAALPEHQQMARSNAREIEQARKLAMKYTGLTPRKIAKIENTHRDHSSVPRFDESAYDFANELNSPFLHFDKHDPDLGQKIWEFIRDGQPERPRLTDVAFDAADQLARHVRMQLQGTGLVPAFAYDPDWDEPTSQGAPDDAVFNLEGEYIPNESLDDEPFDKFSRRPGLRVLSRAV